MKTIPLHTLLSRILLETPNEYKEKVQIFLEDRLEGYSIALGINKTNILNSFEVHRINEEEDPLSFYCDYRYPSAKNVEFFESFEEFYAEYPTKCYLCAQCGCETAHPYICQSCDYQVQIGTARGRVLRVTFRNLFLDSPNVDMMFVPREKSRST